MGLFIRTEKAKNQWKGHWKQPTKQIESKFETAQCQTDFVFDMQPTLKQGDVKPREIFKSHNQFSDAIKATNYAL